MKVLLLDMGKEMRGGQRQVYYLARHLFASSDFDPIVVVPRNSPLAALLAEKGIPFHELPSASDLNPWNIYCFFRFVTSFQPAIIHTNDAKGASLAALAKKWNKQFKLVHSRRVSYRLKAGWSRNKYLCGDAVVAVSQEIRSTLIESGLPQETTYTIHSGIDMTLYTREKNKYSKLTLGAVGALSSQKGFEVLIDALAELKQIRSMPEWQCLIAGDGPLFKTLKEQAEQFGLEENIIFLGYRDSKEVLPEIDILVIPSIDGEGSNAVIKEGWVSTTPLITSDLPSNLELVTHESDGLVFNNKNAKELARCVERLANDHDLQQKLINNGLETVKWYTDTIMADRYIDIYRSIA